MIKEFIKKSLSERRLEKIYRAKQYVKDSSMFLRDFKILPPLNHRIGNEVVSVSPISSISIGGWRNLIRIYDKSNNEERSEFRSHVKNMILSDISSSSILETSYMANLFSSHRAMYFEFLGTAYYSKGDLKQALIAYKELTAINPSEESYLYMHRCLMYIGNENEVIELLNEACKAYPASDILWLSLANAYFRYGKTALANQCILKLSEGTFNNIKGKAHNIENLDNEIKEVLFDKTLVRPAEKLGFQSYTEASVQNYWETLFFYFVNRNRFQHGWSDLCFITENKISLYLKKYSDIKTVLNFGVFCAVPDFNLALKNPDISFIGIDREQSTKKLNDVAFKANNLSFHALDMIDIIYKDREIVRDFVKNLVNSQKEVMVFHARTATLIYPEAIRNFYKSCAKLGVKYIALYENIGLSRTHMQYYDFDELPADTIPYFSIMMIHNYKKFLVEAGYEIVEKEIWSYSTLLSEGKDLWGTELFHGLGDSHVALFAKLK